MSEVRCVLRSLVCLFVSFGHREGFFVSLFDGESAWSAFEKSISVKYRRKKSVQLGEISFRILPFERRCMLCGEAWRVFCLFL
jgi:hypothetical protein